MFFHPSLVTGDECCERLAYYGIAKNLVTYLKTNLHQGNLEAARNVTTWQGTCYLTPLIGALLADSYWGKYWTIAAFSAIYFIGLVALTLSASVPALQPPKCSGSICPEASLLQYGVFFSGLYMIALGTGGIKPCVSSFGADQFDDSDPADRVKKGSFFNWFYFCINIGAFVSGTVIVWIQDNSAFRKWHTEVPHDTSLLYEVDGQTSAIEGSRKLEHTSELEFFDKAAIISSDDAKSDSFTNPWRLCTVTQGMVLDKRVGSFIVPPASLSTFDVISVIIWIPFYGRVLVPIARKFTGREKGFSELQRIGIGLALSILAMLSAALVELRRLGIARSEGLIHEDVAVPMSILWQIPQYFLVGAAEVFAAIGQVEFFYNEAPDAMRSLCSAFALVTVSLGSYLSSIILTLVSYFTTQGGDPGWIPDNLNEGHLDRFFSLIAGINFVNLLVFTGCAMRYRYKKA
ncbi:hypothetical protein DAI22_03g102200 [Oryza sativa Japonica Group]|nr:hypothetical protein DAI22_03g102200 [Oryza sativa Japonica Group]